MTPKTYSLPRITENDYGVSWPSSCEGGEVDQVTKELRGFANPEAFGFESRYRHGLRLIQMLWPKEVKLYAVVEHYGTGDSEVVWNSYFMDAFAAMCGENRVSLTGCASSGKSFAVAVYCILMFMSAPTETTIMVSTTAGTDAERRIWGEIKVLHSALSDVYPVGTLIEYLKCITFDPRQEIDVRGGEGKLDFKRDLGTGIIVIPIPKGGEGDKALGKVIGTHSPRVIWAIDEMPHMMDGILRPESNLEFNTFYQLIVIGNANRKLDPHGKISEPAGGWESVSMADDGWVAGDGTRVVFLHGERGPNLHPAVDPGLTDKSALPFPYLSNRIAIRNVALRNGYGKTDEERIANGKLTIDYMRFAIGFWYGDDVAQTVLSSAYVKEHGADSEIFEWSHSARVKVAGFDPSFSAGGDKNVLATAEIGSDSKGAQILSIGKSYAIKATAEARDSFRKEISKSVVDRCVAEGVLPENFFMDISGDGGLMALEINDEWGDRLHRQVRINGISSLEKTGDEDDRYFDIVTKLWFQVQRAVATGRMRGFDIRSDYAKDLFERMYESVGRGVVRIEPKGNKKTTAGGGFRARMGRSSDDGDAFVYCLEGAKRRGFSLSAHPVDIVGAGRRREIEDFISRGSQSTESAGYLSHEEASESEPEEWEEMASF